MIETAAPGHPTNDVGNVRRVVVKNRKGVIMAEIPIQDRWSVVLDYWDSSQSRTLQSHRLYPLHLNGAMDCPECGEEADWCPARHHICFGCGWQDDGCDWSDEVLPREAADNE